jgi:uncharacterized protein (TIGR02284 family)
LRRSNIITGAEKMQQELVEGLKLLQTAAIDARNGYREALEDAEGRGMTTLFRDMIALHEGNADELGRELVKAGERPEEEGSYMSLVHRTIMNVRSLFDRLDESVLPGLIDGEKRNLTKYDDVLKYDSAPADITSLLRVQRSKIEQKVAQMEAQKAASEHETS